MRTRNQLSERVGVVQRGKGKTPPGGDPIPVPPGGSLHINLDPVVSAIESLRQSADKGEGITSEDLQKTVEAFMEGLKPLVDPSGVVVDAIVAAIQAVPPPQFEMNVPGAEAVPYTFDIEYRSDGRISRVVATPGEAPAIKEFDYS